MMDALASAPSVNGSGGECITLEVELFRFHLSLSQSSDSDSLSARLFTSCVQAGSHMERLN